MGGLSHRFNVLKGHLRQLRADTSKKYRKIRRSLRLFYREHKSFAKGIIVWTLNASLYGFMLNIPAAWVFGMPLTVRSIIGWSLVGYVAFVEVPDAVRKARR